MRYIILTTVIIFMLSTKLKAQIIADFSSNITFACNSAVISFTDNSTPSSGLTYQWDFGNGSTSVLRNPSVAYTMPGSYTIKLVVSDGVSTDTVIKNDYINIHRIPDVQISLDDNNYSGCAPLIKQFGDQTILGDGNIIDWIWDFGDGNLSNEQNPQHVYLFQSNYRVSLTVTDINGCSDVGYLDTLISVYKPYADFLAGYTYSCTSEQNVSFYNNSYGDGNLLYLWDFGDSNISNEKNPVHTYNFNGNFDVSLVVTDEHSCTDTLLKESYINLSGVDASFTINEDTLCYGEELKVTNTSVNAYSFLWDFGDSTVSEQKNPSHIYTESGNYKLTLKAIHISGCVDSCSVDINVEKATADFSLSDNYACEVPVTINYENLSQNTVSYEWHFGNGDISYEKDPSVVYTKNGIYNDTLIVYSSKGCKDIKIIDSSLVIRVPKAYFTPNQFADPWEIKGCAPLSLNFYDNSYYNSEFDSIATFVWNFGDGVQSNEKNPLHIYEDVGEYLVEHYYITYRGCVSSPYYSEIKTGTRQTADFYKNMPDTICASQAVDFFNNSQDSVLVNEWYWRFGDGEYSLKENPTHMYIDTGYMNVKLQAYHNGCGVAEEKKNFIYVKGPVLSPEYRIDCDMPYVVTFDGNVKDADRLIWDFGDGSSIDSVNFYPSHSYPDNKAYTYSLTAVNYKNGCSHNSSNIVVIKDIKSDFYMDTTYGCENLRVKINSKTSQDEYYFKNDNTYALYLWDFGDSTSLHTNSYEIYHTYKKKGTYNLKLFVKDFRGCEDSLTRIIKIYNPEPEFNVKNIEGCVPMNASFENLSINDTLVASWLWDFGDGTFSDAETPLHIYNKHGIYDVKLKITDTLGCINEMLKPNYIEATNPIPGFIADDNTVCFKDTISFIPNDTSKVSSYFWDFGDGNYSSEAFPKHIYDSTGYYTVSLTLVDDKGCDSAKYISNYINIQNYPEPKFSVTDSEATCYPLFVSFSDTTNNSDIADWQWDFGDGETSSHLKFPEHIYTKPGEYDVSLKLTSTNGCKGNNVKNQYIVINGPYAQINVTDTACKNSEITFIAENQKDIFEKQWIFGDGAASNNDTAVHAYNNTGYIYPVLLLKSDNLGTCDIYLKDSIYIPILTSDINSVNNQFSGCVPFNFNGYNNCDGANTWSWNFGDGAYSSISAPEHIYQNAGNYNIQLITANDFGCTDTSEAEVEVFNLPNITTLKDTLICRGDKIKLEANGAQIYEWLPKIYLDNQNTDTPYAQPDSTITYYVTGTDLHSCKNESSVTIKVQQEPRVNLSDTTVIIGEPVILNAYSKDIATYSWFPDYNISCNDCPTVTVTPFEQTSYEVTVTDTAKCFTLTYNADIDIVREYTVDVPNAFTPNGDRINDVLYVRGWGIENLNFFKIFNRYGEIVFETNDKNKGWDGTYKGKPQGVETYTYWVTVRTYDNSLLSKRGTVKLLK
ncbi:MAG: PKD domain-containing protein [Bacteroidales bacterium]|nr:PKD domain-containing protein [Bacteroidales bacterium]